MSELVEDQKSDFPEFGGLVPAISSLAHNVYIYLRTMERRELDVAKKMLAPDFNMVFPGGVCFSNIEELLQYGRGRQGSAYKTFCCFDEFQKDNYSVVYASGTLSGMRLDGSKYQGIRFVDRFTIRNENFLDQHVWNDMGRFGFGSQKQPVNPSIPTVFIGKSDTGAVSPMVLDYINSLENNSVNTFNFLSTEEFEAIIPGGKRYIFPQEFLDVTQSRSYQKNRLIHRIDEIEKFGNSIIYLFGLLQGKLINGSFYENVRFIERISISKSKITSHIMWDDMAEHGFTS